MRVVLFVTHRHEEKNSALSLLEFQFCREMAEVRHAVQVQQPEKFLRLYRNTAAPKVSKQDT